jgi:hypothetical protein
MNPKSLRDDADRAGALAAVGAAHVVVGGLAAAFTKGTPRLASAGLVRIGLTALVLQGLQLAKAIRIKRRREDQTVKAG